MVLRIAAIDSLAASMGPPGSATEIASPATMGARTMRDHSSSVKALFVVTAGPFCHGQNLAHGHPNADLRE